MNTNYNDEKTLLNNNDAEKTVLGGANSYKQEGKALNNGEEAESNYDKDSKHIESKEIKNKKGFHLGEVAAGAASGLLVGGLGTLFMSSTTAAVQNDENSNDSNPEQNTPEEWSGNVNVAHNVNDEMSFGEAFSAARQEVGPGGAFEWHGAVYGTYTQDEWNNMTPQEKQEYADNFDWSKFESDNSDVASHSEQALATQQNVEGDVEVVSVEHNTNSNEVDDDDVEIIHSEKPEDMQTNIAHAENADVVDSDEVEILGVSHDDASGANIGLVNVNGQNVAFIDVDNDNVFDYAASDVNSDGNLQEGEVVDISNQNISMSDFEAKGMDDMADNVSYDSTDDLNSVQDGNMF